MLEIKNKVKKIFRIFGLRITKNFNFIPVFKKDVFNRKYKKRVLLSYLVGPFFLKNNFSHTNYLECYTAAKIFDNLGFSVDVIDYNVDKKVDYNNYEVIYGMGSVLEKSFYFDNKKIKRIFYATGCNPIYSNIKTLLRVRNFNDFHGKMIIDSSRYIKRFFYFQTLLSDGVIVLGNNFVLDTYKNYDKQGKNRYCNLSAFFYDVYNIDLTEKNFLIAKKHFLWFGSKGCLHKGLDLLIDFFSEHQDIFLHICGASKDEKSFFNYYSPLILKSKNIIDHGFVNIRSQEFKDIMNQCAFVVFPSVTEGGAPAILNVIANGGLIPIITTASGLDVDDFGIIIEEPDLEYVGIAIKEALLLNNDQLLNMSLMAKKNIRRNYTYKKYKENLKNLIENITSSPESDATLLARSANDVKLDFHNKC